MRRLVVWSLVGGLIVGLVIGLAWSADAEEAISVDIPIGNQFGVPGDLILVATVDTGPGLVCVGSVDPVNNTSDHDNTDVVYESGQAGGTIFDVEVPTFDPDQTVAFVSEGPTLIYFRIGDDGVISAGFVAMLDCHGPDEPEPEEETTTTTVQATTTTTVPGATTTTTEPAPEGGISTGGGALEHLVSEDPTPVAAVRNEVTFWSIMGWLAVFAAFGTLVWLAFEVSARLRHS